MKTIKTDQAPSAIGPYSQAIEINGMLYTSGQIPLHPETGEITGDNIKEQTEQVIKNIKAILESLSLSFEDVVKTTCFLVEMNDFSDFNAVYEDYFVSAPARSCVAVKELPKGSLVEIEVIARTK